MAAQLIYRKLGWQYNYHHFPAPAFPLATYLILPTSQFGVHILYLSNVDSANFLKSLVHHEMGKFSPMLMSPVLNPLCIALICVDMVCIVKSGAHSTMFNLLDVPLWSILMPSDLSTKKNWARMKTSSPLLI